MTAARVSARLWTSGSEIYVELSYDPDGTGAGSDLNRLQVLAEDLSALEDTVKQASRRARQLQQEEGFST